MKPIFFRGVFLLCAVIIQVSLANMFFPSLPFSVPILLSGVGSLTILKGFAFSWAWAVVGGIFIDAISLGRIGGSSLELVCAAAVFSLTAKELLFRYRLSRILLFGVAVWFFEVALRSVELFLLPFRIGSAFVFSFSLLFASVHWSMVFWSCGFSIIFFALIFPITLAFERYINLFERTNVGRR